jgi:hypothetical protein
MSHLPATKKPAEPCVIHHAVRAQLDYEKMRVRERVDKHFRLILSAARQAQQLL